MVNGKLKISFRHLPNYDSCNRSHIQRMFRAILRKLYATITEIDHLLLHSLNFISEHQPIAVRKLIERVGRKGKTDTALSLLHGKHLIAAPFQIADSFLCRREVNPIDTLLST